MQKLMYRIGKTTEKEQLMLDFWDGLSRTVEDRINLGFVLVKLPVIDDMPYRIFETEELPRLELFREELKKGVTN